MRTGLLALTHREVVRVLKLWSQTIAAPVVSSFLFILVFGLSLGGRIKQVDGVDYEVFIVPGLITMAMAQAAYSNNAASVFGARFDRYINDVLAAPMRAWEVNLGLSLGGAVRAFGELLGGQLGWQASWIGGLLLFGCVVVFAALCWSPWGVPTGQPRPLEVALYRAGGFRVSSPSQPPARRRPPG